MSTATLPQTSRLEFSDRRPRRWQAVLDGLLLAALSFAAVVPTLRFRDYDDGMECHVLMPARSAVRDGRWALPMLNGELRLQKPPLTQWITAVGMLSCDDPYFGARWPTLALASLIPAGVYALGRLLYDRRIGLTAGVVSATSLYFARYARLASYDTQLATWVTWTNVFLAVIVVHRRWWLGCLGAGLMLGAGLLTKGPVAALETVVPFMAYALWVRKARVGGLDDPTPIRTRLIASIAGLALALAVALPWVIYILIHAGRSDIHWLNEMTMAQERAGGLTWKPWEVVVFFRGMLPWLAFMAVGAVVFVQQRRDRDPRRQANLLIVLLTSVPCLLIALVSARDRYLLPMLGPATVMVAAGLAAFLDGDLNVRRRTVVVTIHWLTVAALIAEATWLVVRADHRLLAIAIASGATLMMLASILLQRRLRWSLLIGTTAIMFAASAAHYYGEGTLDTLSCRPLFEQLKQRYPTATLYFFTKTPPLQPALYMDRDIIPLDPAHPDPGALVLLPSRKAAALPVPATHLQDFYYDNERWEVRRLP